MPYITLRRMLSAFTVVDHKHVHRASQVVLPSSFVSGFQSAVVCLFDLKYHGSVTVCIYELCSPCPDISSW